MSPCMTARKTAWMVGIRPATRLLLRAQVSLHCIREPRAVIEGALCRVRGHDFRLSFCPKYPLGNARQGRGQTVPS